MPARLVGLALFYLRWLLLVLLVLVDVLCLIAQELQNLE